VPGDTVLETEDLTKDFAGFVAVRGVNLRVVRGSIHAMIGPNGAGKTTCFNLLTKFLSPSRGRIVFDGRDITALRPADVAQLGLVRSFQISAVFPHLTVLENVRIALQRKRGGSFDFWRSKSVLHAMDERAMALITDVGLAPYASLLAAELSYGRKRALEIATTLALDPAMLLLDEPMAGMGHDRAQSQRRRRSVRPHHGADPRPGARRRRLSDCVGKSRRARSLSRHRTRLGSIRTSHARRDAHREGPGKLVR
jgi:branched-chain amino acid transport system ATP-binding protein